MCSAKTIDVVGLRQPTAQVGCAPFTFFDRSTWLVLALETLFWRVTGTIMGTNPKARPTRALSGANRRCAADDCHKGWRTAPSTWATSANARRERRCWLPLQSDRPRLAARPPTPLWCRRSAEFLGESDEKPFRSADVAEPIRVFIPNYLAYELRSPLTEPLERLVDVVHREHDA